MRTVLIDPARKSVEFLDVQLSMLPGAIKQALKTEDPIAQLIAPGIAMWVDGRGLLKPGGELRLWSLQGIEGTVWAGPALIHGVSPAAQLIDIAVEDPGVISSQINWRDDIAFVGFDEQLAMTQANGGFLPQIQRIPRFEPVQQMPSGEIPPGAVPRTARVVTIFRDGMGGYRAVKHRIGPDGREFEQEGLAGALDEIYDEMGIDPEDAKRFPREPTDHDDVVETWIV
jgi:hypothetical protein